MKDAEIQGRLQDLFRKAFRAPDYVLKPEDTPAELPNWDSLNYITLILEIQKAFGIRVRAVEAGQFRTAGDLLRMISTRVSEKGDTPHA